MGKIIRIFTQSPFCILNFTLPACRPKFAEVACTTQRAERVCSNKYFVIFDCNHGSRTPQFIKVHTTNVFYIIICCYWGRGTRGRVCSAPNEYDFQPGDPWIEPRKQTWFQFGSFESTRGTSRLLHLSGVKYLFNLKSDVPISNGLQNGEKIL
jgi:hypothetical protein